MLFLATGPLDIYQRATDVPEDCGGGECLDALTRDTEHNAPESRDRSLSVALLGHRARPHTASPVGHRTTLDQHLPRVGARGAGRDSAREL